MSGSSDSAYPESICSRQFRFPGQLGSHSSLRKFLGAKVAGKGSSATIYSFMVSAINEEKVCSFNDFYVFVNLKTFNSLEPTRGKASDLRPWRCTSYLLRAFGKTNGLKRQISYFSAKENEKFYDVGKDTWKPLMLVLTMALIHGCCRSLKGMDEPHRGEVGKMKSQPNALHVKAGCTP
ncbi:hypothetical protein CK203_117484 [Vitis vinifera]|uniref:Uncharacterized protein n=1 Tax=Vitis vinifera TaxID=29760 RepID=A0A438C8T8_VITVI|nr:hypothetical protein CK203_117484 [Vitis vinifera]